MINEEKLKNAINTLTERLYDLLLNQPGADRIEITNEKRNMESYIEGLFNVSQEDIDRTKQLMNIPTNQ